MRATETINHEVTLLEVDLEDLTLQRDHLNLQINILNRRINDLHQVREMAQLGEQTLDIQLGRNRS